MIERLPQWDKLMAAAITGRLKQEFRRGVSDCVMTIADIVQAYTATDFAQDYRGTYTDDLGAARIITKGGGDLGAMFAARMAELGAPEISVKFARRGDLAFIYRGRLDQAVGIFSGAGILTPAAVGLKTIARGEASRAWRIG